MQSLDCGSHPVPEMPRPRFRSGQDDPLLDAFRVAASDMQMEEQRLLRQRNSAAVYINRETQAVLIVGSALALLIAALSGWRVAKDRTERNESGG